MSSPPVATPRSSHISSSKSSPSSPPCSEATSATWRPVGGGEPRLVSSLGHHLDLSSPEQRIIQSHGCLHRVLVSELDIGETLRVAIKFVAEDCHPDFINKMKMLYLLNKPVYRATSMEMLL